MWGLEMIKWLNRDTRIEKNPEVKIHCLDEDFMPVYKHEGDAGADVKAFKINGSDKCKPSELYASWTVDTESGEISDWTYELKPGCAIIVECGFSCELPNGWSFLVCPRSGLASKNLITVLNAPGICDSGYRGQYGVILFNAGVYPFTIHKGDRIAQIVLAYTPQAKFVEGDLSDTDRGQGGFGSSGVSDKKAAKALTKAVQDIEDTTDACQKDLAVSAKELEQDLKNHHSDFFQSVDHFKKSVADMSKACTRDNATVTTVTRGRQIRCRNKNKNK